MRSCYFCGWKEMSRVGFGRSRAWRCDGCGTLYPSPLCVVEVAGIELEADPEDPTIARPLADAEVAALRAALWPRQRAVASCRECGKEYWVTLAYDWDAHQARCAIMPK